MITTCTKCGAAYEAWSEEAANEPVRLCGGKFCKATGAHEHVFDVEGFCSVCRHISCEKHGHLFEGGQCKRCPAVAFDNPAIPVHSFLGGQSRDAGSGASPREEKQPLAGAAPASSSSGKAQP